MDANQEGESNTALKFCTPNATAISENLIGISGNDSFTISMWLYLSHNLVWPNQGNIISFGENSQQVGGMALLNVDDASGGRFGFDGRYASTEVLTDGNPFLNKWNQITFTYNGTISGSFLYLNGIQAQSIPWYGNRADQLNLGNTLVTVGAGAGGGNANIEGAELSDIMIYNKALSSNQVSQLYAAQSVPEPSTYALFGIGVIGMLIVLRKKKTV